MLPIIGDTSVPWVLDACCQYVDPHVRRVTTERGWHLVACDVEPGTQEVVRADLNGRLPWCSGQFEAIICTDTLEHIDNYKNAISELGRVLRAGGLMFFSVPMPGKWPNMREKTRRLQPGDEEHGHLWAFGLDVVDEILAHGFRHVGGVYSHDDEIMRLSHIWILERR